MFCPLSGSHASPPNSWPVADLCSQWHQSEPWLETTPSSQWLSVHQITTLAELRGPAADTNRPGCVCPINFLPHNFTLFSACQWGRSGGGWTYSMILTGASVLFLEWTCIWWIHSHLEWGCLDKNRLLGFPKLILSPNTFFQITPTTNTEFPTKAIHSLLFHASSFLVFCHLLAFKSRMCSA